MDLLNNVEFIKGFFLGGLFGLLGMVTWRRKRIKDLQSDLFWLFCSLTPLSFAPFWILWKL